MTVSAARLDNRAELVEALGFSSDDAPRLSNGNLVGLAFDRWGEEVCSYLQGDWAMAAWDARERRLLLARDAFGSSSLYFHEGKGFIAFASSLKALLALPGVVKEPDRLRLARCWLAAARCRTDGLQRIPAPGMGSGYDRWLGWPNPQLALLVARGARSAQLPPG